MSSRSASPAVALLLLAPVAAHADDAWFLPKTPPVTPQDFGTRLARPANPPEISLALPLTSAAAPALMAVAAAAPVASPTPPVRLPRLTVSVGAGVTMPNTDNPPVDVSVNLLGGDPSSALPVTVAGQSEYGAPVDVRIPEHQLGLRASYILSPDPRAGMPDLSIGASFGLNTYGPMETEREGEATLRLGF